MSYNDELQSNNAELQDILRSVNELPDEVTDAVRYSEQNLSEDQQAQARQNIGAQPAGNYALVSQIPNVPVQSVNGKTGAVKLSADDVGARASDWMPSAEDVGALPTTYTPPNQTAEQVGAEPNGTAAAAVSGHNTSTDAHGDIRQELQALTARLNAFFDSDDQTLDELSEIVAYITSNKTLIDAITTSKVSVADIIDNLTTNVSNKPLSAAQGVVLKCLIDTLSSNLSKYALTSAIPTKVSQLQNDAGYLKQHQDISHLLPKTELSTAINTALAQAKASGEFNGAPGYTPQPGIDYNTPADQEAIVQQVIAALGTPVFGTVDTDKKITLSIDHLADGTYELGYEDEDGNWVGIGMLEKGGTSYTNLADPTSADWLTNKRLNSSGVVTDTTPSLTTNYIPVKMGDIVRIRYANIYHQGSGASNATTHFYDADKNRVASVTPATSDATQYFVRDADRLGCTFNMEKVSELFTIVSGTTSDIRYVRFSGKLYDGYTKDDVIITVNEEITE